MFSDSGTNDSWDNVSAISDEVTESITLLRLDKVQDPVHGWSLKPTGELPVTKEHTMYDHYKSPIIVQRTISTQHGFMSGYPPYPPPSVHTAITVTILIQSAPLKRVLKDVLKGILRLDWNSKIFEVALEPLIAHYNQLKKRLHDLSLNTIAAEDEGVLNHLSALIVFLEEDYAHIIEKISDITSHGEITFDLLWAIFLPQTVVFTKCTTTSEPRALRVREYTSGNLMCDYYNDFSLDRHLSSQMDITVYPFKGVMKITDLNVYPIKWHPRADEVQQALVSRGRKALQLLAGICHMQYDGIAYSSEHWAGSKYKVKGRIMIDRQAIVDEDNGPPPQNSWPPMNPLSNGNYSPPLPTFPLPTPDPLESNEDDHSLQDADFMLNSPVVRGFNFSSKRWLYFNVDNIKPITWSDEAFENLVLDPDRKILIKCLVESQAGDYKLYDDFVQGKGCGLIINLHGPPGVGKTLTVESACEHLKRPLYAVCASELGTTPTALDQALTRIFTLAPTWNAILLIDEADVFLEERGIGEVERNAMVAVFLRQIEYFNGILFLTTNRVKELDRAFQSRIHLSLPYHDLPAASRRQLWQAFLKGVAENVLGSETLTPEQMSLLAGLELNGRQIKNLVKLASTIASHEQKALTFEHLTRVVKIFDSTSTSTTIGSDQI